MFRAGSQGSTLPKNGIATRYRFSLWTGPFRGCFQFLFNSRRDQKRARQIHALERVAILFWGCDMTLGTHPAASKFARKHETTKGTKDDTNIHVVNWGDLPLGVQILYTFPTTKMGMKQIEQFSDIILHFLRFLAESSGVAKLELFQPLPHCKWGFSRCTDSARLRQDSAAKDIKTGTKLW